MANITEPAKPLSSEVRVGAIQGVAGYGAGEVLRYAIPILTSSIGFLVAVWKGLHFPWNVAFGLGVTLVLAVVANFISLILTRRRPKQLEASATVPTVLTECPDTWLHEIARDQAETIFRFIHITRLVIAKNELFGRSDPYMEIQLAVDNRSVYDVTLDDPRGAIFFANRELSGELGWAERVMPTHNNEGVVTLKQRLDAHDVIHVLNSSPEETFDFSRLQLRVKGVSPNGDSVTSQSLNLGMRWMNNAPLIERNPKMEIAVLSGVSTFVCNFQTWGVSKGDTPDDGYITLEVSLKNLRTTEARIESFLMEASLRGKPCVAQAETSETVWERTNISESGDLSRSGKQFKNLAGISPLNVNQSSTSGHLQFFFREAGGGQMLDAIPYKLVMTDKSGEKHYFESVMPENKG